MKPKIIGGNETVLSKYPFMAFVNLGKNDSPYEYCGGSIIGMVDNSIWVITAAHCFV